ncbi:MAG TPA: ABC transporter transmembrane domain-containing protein, partial [Longimicrobiales bacterium]|nr:ABC transporter transmembrane domain-containing protein [Longimicrobiales bacterium]
MPIRQEAALYGRVLAYLGRYRASVVGAILATVAFAALDAFSILMLIPFLNALFGETPMDVGADNEALEWLLAHTMGLLVPEGVQPTQLLLGVVVFLLVVYVLKNLFDFIQSYLVVRLEQGVTRDMRNQVYEHLLELDLRFFGKTRAGQVISRLTVDVDQVRSLITRNIAKAVTSTLQILAAVAALLAISGRL